MIFVSFRFLWGKEKRFTPDLTFRGEAATLHGSTLLTEKNPSLVTSVTGGPGAAYWGDFLSAARLKSGIPLPQAQDSCTM